MILSALKSQIVFTKKMRLQWETKIAKMEQIEVKKKIQQINKEGMKNTSDLKEKEKSCNASRIKKKLD